MFCPFCGTQNDDNSTFCSGCGASMNNASAAQTASSMPSLEPMGTTEPIQSAQPSVNAQPSLEPMGGVQPNTQQAQQVQPSFAQQPFGQPTANPMPDYGQPVVPLKKSKKTPIIIASCIGAVVVAFIIVLFTVIIPNSGFSGKLKHKWEVSQNGVSMIFDFKESTASVSGISVPFTWENTGDNRIELTISLMGQSSSQEFDVSFSSDGKSMTLTQVDDLSSAQTFTRVD